MKIIPKKSLGQNWMINPHILDKIVAAAEINSNDTVLEIGPGTGNLTEKLAQKSGTVIAIEKDGQLVKLLEEKFRNKSNVKIIESDILKFKIETLIENYKFKIENFQYKMIGNIPYYLTSNLLREIFESASWRIAQPRLIVLTIQKEVAQRIVAKPPHTNLLALSAQYYSEPKIIGYISKNNFRPVPKVDSAIVQMVPRDTAPNTKLFELIHIGFSEKRKQLAGTLSKKLKVNKEKIIEVLEKEGIGSKIRPENLSLEQWQELVKIL